jgi:hypothetical protein
MHPIHTNPTSAAKQLQNEFAMLTPLGSGVFLNGIIKIMCSKQKEPPLCSKKSPRIWRNHKY